MAARAYGLPLDNMLSGRAGLIGCLPCFCIYNNLMEYEWDEAKRAANLRKHGVDFESVTEFDWSAALLLPDARHDYGEPRWVEIGPIGGRVHCLVFTKRGGRIRVISLRKANRREVKRHESQT